MSDLQPWRHPRTAPARGEVLRAVVKSSVPPWLRAWWPAFIWATAIFTFSTDSFSAEHTARFLSPLVHWLFPHLTPHQFNRIHHLIRKSAHFTEYFIFYLFIFRGIRGDRTGWRWSWGLPAWFVAAVYSCLDEIHQAFVVSRTASPYDSLLDSIGALVAFVVVALWFRSRGASPLTLSSDSSPET
ncbi:MAG TPA: VanZ family protein [Candidatus Acidoferrum sp.]|nr:VanZ family protein [Candidatus Acidoferrum sp.]